MGQEKNYIEMQAMFEGMDDSLIESHSRAFMPSLFVTAALPLKKVNKSVFERKYNGITLSLQGNAAGVPYGKYARLILSILTTHAVIQSNLNQNGSLTITYKSMKEFLDDLQLPKQRSQNIKEQLDLFSSCQFLYAGQTMVKPMQKDFFLDYMDTTNLPEQVFCKLVDTGNITFIDRLKRVDITNEKGTYISSTSIEITISEKFVSLVKEHAIPIDYTTYKKISSPLGKDLYVWFTYRNNYIKEDSVGLFISRKSLVDQFLPQSSPEQERKNYAYIIELIHEIKRTYYKKLNVAILDTGGIMLYKSESVIEQHDVRYVPLLGSMQ